MKKLIALCVTVFGLAHGTHAQLVFDSNSVEGTAALSDKKLVGEFKFKNTGHTTIKILSVKPSCECTIATLDKTAVGPGECGVIRATFNIGDRRGTNIKTIAVVTDDPAHSDAILRFVATVPDVVHIEPILVYWKAGEKPEPKKFKVKAGFTTMPVHLSQVSSSDPNFKTSVETVKDGAEYVVTITPVDTKSRGKATLRIQTDVAAPQWSEVKAYALVK
jgi:hypothetical protein